MMSLTARELRRERWSHPPVARMQPRAESGNALSRIALRFIRATGFWLHGVRP
jgi:hypothetical protein